MATLNGFRLLTARIPEPRVGAWHASVTIDHDAALTGAALIDLDGVTFSGTVLRSGVHGGHVSVRVVGGAGGLSKELGAKAYTSTKASTVLGDILREAGETLSSTVDVSLTSGVLARWERSAGAASHALVSLIDELGLTWRVLRDGTIWIGKATYPEANAGAYVLRDEDWTSGAILISPEAPLLEPGTTFRGQQIEQVETVWQSNKLTAEAFVNSPRSTLERFLGSIRRRIDYSREYPARVVKQNTDGTLQLVPDDDVVKGAGLDKVPMRFGLPGITAEVLPGARCRLVFAAGDPSRPEVIAFEAGAALKSIQIEALVELKLKSIAVKVGANPDAALPLAAGSASQPSASFYITTP